MAMLAPLFNALRNQKSVQICRAKNNSIQHKKKKPISSQPRRRPTIIMLPAVAQLRSP
jgi:hypothetical protein